MGQCTAAVVSSIGSITVEGKETVFNGFQVGKVTQALYDHLTRIQDEARAIVTAALSC